MIRYLKLTCLFLLALYPFVAAASPTVIAHSTTLTEEQVRYWATSYGLDPDRLWQMALCESSGDPYAENGPHYGLFQFLPSTYLEQRALLNDDPTLAPNLTAFDPEWRGMDADDGAAEAHVAAWSIYAGYAGLWACEY